MAPLQHPYAAFLHRVEKPNRYTGGEHGVVRKDWSSVEARVCLAFPEVYDIGMSHLGTRILYRVLNDDPRTLAERCYAPWVDLDEALLRHGKLLLSLESARPLCDFDVVGFSLQYELTYTNVLRMLELGGIPARSEHRGDDDPLVLGGGPVATHAEPMAPFFDAFLIGDGEEAATEIALAWTEGRRRRAPREERLRRLASIEGVYVPSLYATAPDPASGLEVVTAPLPGTGAPFPVRRRLLEDLDRFPFPDAGPVGGPEAIFDRASIEIARGCTEGCRFCQAGMIYRPVRERDPARVIETVLSTLAKTGQDEVSLTALSTADVSCISPLIRKLVEETAPERVSLSVASLRAYGLAPELLDDLGRVRATGLTFAPEAGTQRMRDVINKNVTEAQLLETAERVFSRGFDRMKLYFICGLPTETDDDVLGIVDVGKNALGVGKRLGKRASVTVSVSVHVPKPHTPFQWCAMDPPEQIAHKQSLLRAAARKERGLTLRLHDARSSVLEAVLARGDRRLAPAIEAAWLGGARFDGWDDQLRLDAWEEAFRAHGVEPSRYTGTLPVDARLPWDHLDVGLEEGFLLREYRKALAGRASPPCGKVRGQFVHAPSVAEAKEETGKLVCYDCGVACDLTRMRQDRVVRLTSLGAFEPGARARLPVVSARQPARPEAWRPPRVGTPSRWRLRFSKLGPLALLGHLDLLRELPRTLRRAGLRLAYSEGFHPKPELSPGPALSVGVASLDEYVDVTLLDAPASVEELLSRLSSTCPPGLAFLAAAPLGAGAPGLGRVITAAEYALGVPRTLLSELGGEAGLRARVEDFLARAEHVTVRRIEGVGKRVDVRALVEELHAPSTRAGDALRAAGIVGVGAALLARVRLTQQGSVKASEVVEAVLGSGAPALAVRARLLAGGASPLELAGASTAPRTVSLEPGQPAAP